MTFPIWWEKWKPCSKPPTSIYIYIYRHTPNNHPMTSPCPAPRMIPPGWDPPRHLALAGSVARPSRFVSWTCRSEIKIDEILEKFIIFFMFFLRFRTFSWFFACLSTVWTARPRICSFLKPQHHFLWPQSALLGVHLARSCQKGHRGPWLRAFWWHGQDGAFLALNGRSGSQWFITVYGHKH